MNNYFFNLQNKNKLDSQNSIINMKYILHLFFLSIALLFSFQTYSQPIKPKQLLKKIDASLNDIETLVYKIERTDKNFASKDTVRSTAVCSLYIAPKDKMKAYYIFDKQLLENTLSHHKYDGAYYSSIYYTKDSLDLAKKITIESVVDNGYLFAENAMRDYDLKYFLYDKKAFRRYNSLYAKLFHVKEIKVEETTYLNTPVYLLTIYARNKKSIEYINNAVDKYYIRKSDFLPIAHSFSGELENMTAYEYYEVDYLSINSDIPLEEFKVDTTQTEVRPKSIYENVKKFGL